MSTPDSLFSDVAPEDRIELSEPAKARLADLIARHLDARERLELFIADCALALDIDCDAFAFDIASGSFVCVLAPVKAVGEGAHGEVLFRRGGV